MERYAHCFGTLHNVGLRSILSRVYAIGGRMPGTLFSPLVVQLIAGSGFVKFIMMRVHHKDISTVNFRIVLCRTRFCTFGYAVLIFLRSSGQESVQD